VYPYPQVAHLAYSVPKRNHLKYQLEIEKSMNQLDSIGISSATVQ
jgi:hypothetical protein